MNSTLDSIQPSATLAIAAKAKEMIAQGISVCSFAAGEPDFDTPDVIKAAAIDAINAGHTKYTPVKGLPALCKAVADKLANQNGIIVDPATQVLVSSGGKQSLANAFTAILNKGDEVIIPSPYWLSYPEMVRLAGGRPKLVKTTARTGFKITPAALERAIKPKTVAVVLNYPSNPTGAIYSAEELRAIGDVCVRRGIYIIADEMYERMTWGGVKFVSMASLSKEIAERTITINGCSKAYSMTGWRIGYAAGPAAIIKAMTTVQSHLASNPATPSQYAAIAALANPESEAAIQPMLKAFEARASRIYKLLKKIPGIKIAKPEGAFYVFPSIKVFGMDSVEFCKRLLEEKAVAAVPGVSFGAPDHIRFSYACSMENIEEGMKRFADFCENLHSSAK